MMFIKAVVAQIVQCTLTEENLFPGRMSDRLTKWMVVASIILVVRKVICYCYLILGDTLSYVSPGVSLS